MVDSADSDSYDTFMRMAASPHELSSRRDEMFIDRDGLKVFSPFGSGDATSERRYLLNHHREL